GSHNTLVRNAHGSSFTENIILKLNEQGINCYDWNVDSGDAKGNNIPAATIYNNVVKESRDKNGELKSPAIVLMHDCMTKTTTVEALPKIIQYFKEQGYKFDTLN
ncbi:MAG: polysaccharide deacetylase, partial [Clostridium sp.]